MNVFAANNNDGAQPAAGDIQDHPAQPAANLAQSTVNSARPAVNPNLAQPDLKQPVATDRLLAPSVRRLTFIKMDECMICGRVGFGAQSAVEHCGIKCVSRRLEGAMMLHKLDSDYPGAGLLSCWHENCAQRAYDLLAKHRLAVKQVLLSDMVQDLDKPVYFWRPSKNWVQSGLLFACAGTYSTGPDLMCRVDFSGSSPEATGDDMSYKYVPLSLLLSHTPHLRLAVQAFVQANPSDIFVPILCDALASSTLSSTPSSAPSSAPSSTPSSAPSSTPSSAPS